MINPIYLPSSASLLMFLWVSIARNGRYCLCVLKITQQQHQRNKERENNQGGRKLLHSDRPRVYISDSTLSELSGMERCYTHLLLTIPVLYVLRLFKSRKLAFNKPATFLVAMIDRFVICAKSKEMTAELNRKGDARWRTRNLIGCASGKSNLICWSRRPSFRVRPPVKLLLKLKLRSCKFLPQIDRLFDGFLLYNYMAFFNLYRHSLRSRNQWCSKTES